MLLFPSDEMHLGCNQYKHLLKIFIELLDAAFACQYIHRWLALTDMGKILTKSLSLKQRSCIAYFTAITAAM